MVETRRVLGLSISMVLLGLALLWGLYVYRVSQSRQLNQRIAIENQAIGSQERLQMLRAIMGLAPTQLECANAQLTISMAHFACGIEGSVQVQVRPDGNVLYEGTRRSGYTVDGVYAARLVRQLSPSQRKHLTELVERWPKFDPQRQPYRPHYSISPYAMLVCIDGQRYGIPSTASPQDQPRPDEELLQVLGAMPTKAPNVPETVCFH